MKRILLLLISLFSLISCEAQVSKTISQEVLQSAPFDSATYWRSARIGYNFKIRSTDYAAWLRLNYVLPDTVSILATKYDLLSVSPSPIEITRAQAATHEAANGGNGDWVDGAFYRITNPLTPLHNVVLQAIKDKNGNARLLTTGKGFTSATPNVEMEIGYDALTNTINYINQSSQGNYISKTPTAYAIFDFSDPTAINNTIKNCYVSFGGGTTNAYSNNVITGSSLILNNGELSGSILSGNSGVSVTGSAFTDAYVYVSQLRNASLTTTSDSKVSGCTFENITVTGSGVTLTNCTFIGNGESITLPSGYSATGKTFISGVSSSFEADLDLTDGAIYNATGSSLGQGTLTIPASLNWIGKFTLRNDYPTIGQILQLSAIVPNIIITTDPADVIGFVLSQEHGISAAVAGDILFPTHFGVSTQSFDAFYINAFAIVTAMGDKVAYVHGMNDF